MSNDQVITFSADWPCFCGSIIGVEIPLAIVKSIGGLEVRCKHCHQFFKVREDGAYPFNISNGKGEASAEEIQDSGSYRVSLPSDNPPISLRFHTDGRPGPGEREAEEPEQG